MTENPSPTRTPPGAPRPPLAWLPVTGVAVAVTTVLLIAARGYDYHRDELYFRMLAFHPQWGYVDQPPLTPLLARLGIEVFGDSLWALRAPSAVMLGVTAVLVALIAREMGGGALAQTLAALGVVSAFPLTVGHVVLTAGPDLVVWSLVILFAMRALLRDDPRWWLVVGLVTGVGLYNKHLVIVLLLCLGVALLAVGPRRVLRSGWLWAGVGVALVVGSPNLVYQVVNDFPQADMAAALAENKGDEARTMFVPMQILILGPPAAVVAAVGLVRLARDRTLRAFALAYPVMCVFLLVIAGQPYYTMGLVLALYAVGCVPVAGWMRGFGRRALVVGLAALNMAVSLTVALPVVPEDELGGTPIPGMNQAARDQIGWPAYVRQVADVHARLAAGDRARTVVLTGNYGEAGAIDRYGPAYGLPVVYSGQNELWHLRRPPETATVVIVVFDGGDALLARSFAACTVEGVLDNGVGVDNEEQGVRIRVCRDPVAPWSQLWPDFQHFD